jgi:GNAT superfamily N-acetyltransferase
LGAAEFSAAGLEAIMLSDADAPALQRLLERCRDYFELVEGHPAGPEAAVQELRNRPPECPAENVVCFGLYDGAVIGGVICTLRDYPAADEWYVGLMLLEPSRRGAGHGGAVYAGFEGWVAARRARVVRLAVVAANARAAAFWERQGFGWPRSYPAREFGVRKHVVIEYEKRLGPGGKDAM